MASGLGQCQASSRTDYEAKGWDRLVSESFLRRPANEAIVEGLIRTVNLRRGNDPTPAGVQDMGALAGHALVVDTLLAPGICPQMKINLGNCSFVNQNSAIGNSLT